MARRKLAGLRMLITGASSGIGEALALQAAAAGARVLATARRQERLEAVAAEAAAGHPSAPPLLHLAGDLLDPLHRAALLRHAASHLGGLDVLVNNAGRGAIGRFASAEPSRLQALMELNFFAPAELTRSAVPLLRAASRPAVVFVGSVLGHVAVPLKAEYCASKFALHGLADALRIEWRSDGIEILLISPSTTRSEFFQRVLGDAQLSRSWGAMDPAEVARRILRAVRSGRRESIFPWSAKALIAADRWVPRLLARILRVPRDEGDENGEGNENDEGDNRNHGDHAPPTHDSTA